MAYTKEQIQQMIIDSANSRGIDPAIALAIASHESGFNPNAVNTANPNGTKDWGVMQLNDTTVQTIGVTNPLDPKQNIDAGVSLLAGLLNRYSGNVRNALWAYASGPGNVGPTKTPNSIAQGFIDYVNSYTGGSVGASPPNPTRPRPRRKRPGGST